MPGMSVLRESHRHRRTPPEIKRDAGRLNAEHNANKGEHNANKGKHWFL